MKTTAFKDLSREEKIALSKQYPKAFGTIHGVPYSLKELANVQHFSPGSRIVVALLSLFLNLLVYGFIATIFLGDIMFTPSSDYPFFALLVIFSIAAANTFFIYATQRAVRKKRLSYRGVDYATVLGPQKTSYLFRIGIFLRSPVGWILLAIGFIQTYMIQVPIGFFEWLVLIGFVLICAAVMKNPRRLFHVDAPAASFAMRTLRGAMGGANQKAAMKNALDKMDD